MKKLTFIIAATLLLTGLAHAKEAPFSANDLAILFPVDPQTQTPLQIVTLKTADWKLLSEANFKAILQTAEKNQIFLNEKLKKPENWHLVGLRYAPCTIFVGKQLPCTEQIRFVLQPLRALRPSGFDDYSMHIVFNYKDLPAAVNSPRLESFRLLKNQFGAAQLNKTLKPNTLLASDQGKKYFQALQSEVIAKHINNRSASLVTFMGLAHFKEINEEDPHDWRFFAGRLDKNNQWVVENLPTGHMQTVQSAKIEEEGGFVFNIKPIKGQENLMSNVSTEESLRAALNILKMNKTNDHNVDCASCHFADAFVFPVMLDETPAEKNKFIQRLKDLFKNNSRMTEVVINNDIHVGRHASEFPIPRVFGYLDGSPLISQRAVLDNATSVEQANKVLGLTVTPVCSTDAQRTKFLDCLYFGKMEENVSSCLKKACY